MMATCLEHGQEVPDEVPILVILLAKADRAVDAEELVEEGAGRQPHPVAIVDMPIPINEEAVKRVPPLLPVDVQVTTGQETGNCMPGQMMHPALLLQLHHDGINPGVACARLLPGLVKLIILIPVNLPADRVALHLVKILGGPAYCVEELTPQQLTLQ